MEPVEPARLAAAWAEGAAADLQGLLGCEVALAPAGVKHGARDALLPSAGARVHGLLRTRDGAREPLHLVVPVASAAALAAARLGQPAPAAQAADALEGEVHDAFVESLELGVGILGRVLAELGQLPGVELEACAVLPEPLPEDAPLPAGEYRSLACALRLADAECGELALLFPEALATRWFGPAEAGAPDAEGCRPLAVIDPDPARRQQGEALAEALGRPVWSLDPAEFGPHSFDELRETGAVIVAWDLGGVVGLDLLDDLRGDPRTAALPVALATADPTRERVLLALRWGAATVLHLPLDADEVARRLAPAPG